MDIISSTKNEKLKNISALLKSKKSRDEQGVFVIEGSRLIRDTAKTAPKYFDSIFVSENYDLSEVDIPQNVPVYTVKDSVFASVSDTVNTQGILAVVRKPVYTLDLMMAGGKNETAKLLLLENIQDPGNLGTMLRTAEAAGMTGIVMSSGCTDIFSPKVVRSSMGSVFRMPFLYCEDFTGTLDEIKKQDVTIYAAYLHGGVSYKELDFEKNYGILIGNEGNGLSEEAVNAASKRVFIPMAGEIESLNAAVAAAILMYK